VFYLSSYKKNEGKNSGLLKFELEEIPNSFTIWKLAESPLDSLRRKDHLYNIIIFSTASFRMESRSEAKGRCEKSNRI